MTMVRPPACSSRMQPQELLAGERVQAGHRLVEHEHLRLHGEHAGEGHAALLAAGQVEGAALGKLVEGQPHQGQALPHAAVDFLGAKPHVARPEGYVVVDGVGEQLVLGILEHESHLAAHFGGDALFRQVAPIGQNTAARGMHKAVHMLDERGFSAAGVPRDAEELPRLHREGHIAQAHTASGALPQSAWRAASFLRRPRFFFASPPS